MKGGVGTVQCPLVICHGKTWDVAMTTLPEDASSASVCDYFGVSTCCFMFF